MYFHKGSMPSESFNSDGLNRTSVRFIHIIKELTEASNQCFGQYLVEVMGIEPMSETISFRTSPGAVYV